MADLLHLYHSEKGMYLSRLYIFRKLTFFPILLGDDKSSHMSNERCREMPDYSFDAPFFVSIGVKLHVNHTMKNLRSKKISS